MQVWADQVAINRPQVVGLELGRWEVADHLFRGRWTHVGQPLWDDHLAGELNQAVKLLASRGAKVVLFTMPYMNPPIEASNGSLFSENLPGRADSYNQLVNEVGRSNPGVATVIDLNRGLDPDGHFTATIDGQTVRWSDGVHITIAGGELVQPDILPTLAALGLVADVAPGGKNPAA
jgi:hypothetical protein